MAAHIGHACDRRQEQIFSRPTGHPPSRRTDIFMTLAYGGTAKEAGLDGHVIRVKKLEETAVKVIPAKKR